MSELVDLQVSESINPIELPPVNRLDLIKYAGASDDYNPIHTIDDAAKKAGLPGIIAHGMWTMGNLSRLFSPHFEEGYIEDYHVRFSGMVMLDDVIFLNGTLTERQDDLLIFDVNATNQEGKKVIQGSIQFRLI